MLRNFYRNVVAKFLIYFKLRPKVKKMCIKSIYSQRIFFFLFIIVFQVSLWMAVV